MDQKETMKNVIFRLVYGDSRKYKQLITTKQFIFFGQRGPSLSHLGAFFFFVSLFFLIVTMRNDETVRIPALKRLSWPLNSAVVLWKLGGWKGIWGACWYFHGPFKQQHNNTTWPSFLSKGTMYVTRVMAQISQHWSCGMWKRWVISRVFL